MRVLYHYILLLLLCNYYYVYVHCFRLCSLLLSKIHKQFSRVAITIITLTLLLLTPPFHLFVGYRERITGKLKNGLHSVLLN
jgi:hypothetical protein